MVYMETSEIDGLQFLQALFLKQIFELANEQNYKKWAGYIAVIQCFDSFAGILLDLQKSFELSDGDTGLLQTGNKIS